MDAYVEKEVLIELRDLVNKSLDDGLPVLTKDSYGEKVPAFCIDNYNFERIKWLVNTYLAVEL